jgi:hypothetical protein
MTTPLITTALILFTSSLALGQSEWSDAWEFDDAPGTTIDQAANTGYFGQLQFDQDDPPTGGVVFGGGRFMLGEPGAWSNRKLDLTGYRGMLTIEWSIHSWELDSKDEIMFQNFRQVGIRLRSGELSETSLHVQLHQMKVGNLKLYSITPSFGKSIMLENEEALPMVNYSIPFVIRMEIDTEFGDYNVFVNDMLLANGGEAGLTSVNQLQLYAHGGVSATEFNPTPFVNDYVIYDSLRINATVLPGSDWAGFEIDENGWVDTGSWLGAINVTHGPWVWSELLGKYIYLPVENVTEAGAWMHLGSGDTPPGGDNTWNGYPLMADSYADTGNFIGLVHVLNDPWIFSFDMNMYLYMPVGGATDSGNWTYALR